MSIFQMRKLRLQEVGGLAQGHSANRKRIGTSFHVCLTLRPIYIRTTCCEFQGPHSTWSLGNRPWGGRFGPVIQHLRGRAGARMQSPPHSWTGVGLRSPAPRLASGFQAPWGWGWDSWALGASNSGVPSGDSHPLLPDLFARNASHGDRSGLLQRVKVSNQIAVSPSGNFPLDNSLFVLYDAIFTKITFPKQLYLSCRFPLL